MTKAIEFKAGALTAMSAIVRELDTAQLATAIDALLGGRGEHFDGEVTVIDLGQIKELPEKIDWVGIAKVLRQYGLQPIATRNIPDSLHVSARKAGLAVLPGQIVRVAATPVETPAQAELLLPEPQQPKSEPAPVVEAKPPVTAPAVVNATKIIDRPVRSGQQIYARGGDLILLNGVSPGAEVIADGSIHCYGPLRGRALAGAQGNTLARVFCSNFGPELLSIAGLYRTFEGGIPATVAGKPAQAFIKTEGEKQSVALERLQLD